MTATTRTLADNRRNDKMSAENTTQAQAVNTEQVNLQPATSSEVETQVTEVAPENETDFKVSEDGKPKELEPWIKGRLERERHKAEKERLKREETERELLMLKLNQQQANVQPQNNQPETDPLTLINQVVRERIEETLHERAKKEAQEVQQRQFSDFNAKLQKGFNKYDDFDIVLDESTPISPQVANFLQAIPDPDDFAYNLVKYNSGKLEEINKMHPAMQIVKANELYQAFKSKAGRKVASQAPQPTQQVKTAVNSAKDVQNMTYDELFEIVNGKKR